MRTLAILGLEDHEVAAIEWIDNGPGWIGVELSDPGRIGSLSPRPVDDSPVEVAVVAIGSTLPGVDVELRCFFGTDITEDPVTGSANAGFAKWFDRANRIPFPYTAAQGNYIGRDGRVYVSRDSSGRIWVGGAATTVVTGSITV